MGGNGKLLFVSNVWGVALMLGGPRQDIALRIFWSCGAFSVQSFAIQGCSFALLPNLLSLPLLPLLPNCIAGKLISSLQKCYLTFLHLTHRIKQRNAYKYTNTRAVIPENSSSALLEGNHSERADRLPGPDLHTWPRQDWALLLHLLLDTHATTNSWIRCIAPNLDITECCCSFIILSRMHWSYIAFPTINTIAYM